MKKIKKKMKTKLLFIRFKKRDRGIEGGDM